MEIAEKSQRNTHQAHHQIRDGQVQKKQLNIRLMSSSAENCNNGHHQSIADGTNYCTQS